MIGLPDDLAPWRASLDLFPADLAGDLGKMLPRLALALGPMRAVLPTRSGDPDGFSCIARRGSYERLLLSEWLLADELPDEFARRASMGEHAFFQIALRSPARAASSVAIFDAGPDQIGSPRVAQLAALIVLAARAEQVGARFAWALAADPRAALITAVTKESVVRLLHARTALPAGPDEHAVWAERAAKSGWEDAWMVGGRPPARTWKQASLEIRDVLDPGRRALTLVARAPRSSPREVTLDLPDARACVRLVRDPFAVIAPPPRRQTNDLAPASNLVFAVNGSKLFARGKGGEIITYPVPGSPREPLGRPKRYRPHAPGVVAAVGWVQRGLVMITVGNTLVTVEHTTSRGATILDTTARIPGKMRVAAAQAGDALEPLFFRETGGGEILFLDARRALFLLRTKERYAQPTLEMLASEVTAIASFPDELAFVGRRAMSEEGAPISTRTIPRGAVHIPPGAALDLDASFHLVTMPDWAGVQPKHTPTLPSLIRSKEGIAGDGTFEARFGGEDKRIVAVQRHADVWSIPPRGGGSPPVEITPPAGTQVVSVYEGGPASEQELVIIEADRRSLSLIGRRSSRSLPRASAPIRDATQVSARGHIAYSTVTGEVVIHSLRSEAPLARFVPEG